MEKIIADIIYNHSTDEVSAVMMLDITGDNLAGEIATALTEPEGDIELMFIDKHGIHPIDPPSEGAQERYDKAVEQIPGDIYDDEYGEYNRKQVELALKIASGLKL